MTTMIAKHSAGLGPLLAKENRKWWGTRRWWVQMLLWLGILNGLLAVVLFVLPTLTTPDGEPIMTESPLDAGVGIYFGLGALALALAAPILMQDEVIGEKESGTADWILSKPVARSAFILAKAAAHSLGMALLMVMIPTLGAYLLFGLALPGGVEPGHFALAAGLMLLHTLFYAMLALLLGVVVSNRGLVLGIAIGFFFAGQFAAGFVPALDAVTPWLLPKIAVPVALGAPLAGWMLPPVVATAAWIGVFIVAALRRFARAE